MIETTSLLPPSTGPMANPLLFGVAEGLSMLFPLVDADRRAERDPDELDDATVTAGRGADSLFA